MENASESELLASCLKAIAFSCMPELIMKQVIPVRIEIIACIMIVFMSYNSPYNVRLSMLVPTEDLNRYKKVLWRAKNGKRYNHCRGK